ncbi:NAC domain-containing protein 2-like [Cucumis melo]|uniref:NAC domain-containing protein 2-like n=1 Tax=Cucumis melo TaxID=3656 RepID=A0ABM3KXA0_CUCME|nr:NAC domain-containing protein 2-like [Cucumis melo]
MDSSSGYLPLPLNQYVGVKFRPTDQQLLHYLYSKINGQPYFQGAIFDFDLYGGTEPWEIWQSFKGIDGEDLYFFTKLKRSTKNCGQLSAHISRKIGLANGTWSGENSATPIFANEDDEQIIGYRKRFRYENDQVEEHHGEWIMHEYRLHQSYLAYQDVDHNYVLCRIRKNERAKRKLEIRELQQPNKKRMTAPKIYPNKRLKTKAKESCLVDQLQPIEPRLMIRQTIYNSNIMPDKTTCEDISVVDHVPNMTANQHNVYTPLMATNIESNNLGTGLNLGDLNDDEWMNCINLDELNDVHFPFYTEGNFDEIKHRVFSKFDER